MEDRAQSDMTMHQIPCSTPDPDLVRLAAVSQTPLPLAVSQSFSRTSAQSGHSAGTTHSIRATTQPAGRRRWLRAVLAVAALGVGGVAQAQDPGTTPPRTAADDVFGGTPEIPTVIRGSGLMVMPMGTIDDLTLVVGEPPHQEEVADKFKSTYPNLLRYSAVSSNMAAATVSVSGSVVTVTPVAPGMTRVTVTATNGTNSAQQEFSVTVRNPRLDAPRRVGRLDDVTLVKGQSPHPVAVEDAFSGDLLMYSAVSSNPGVATVTVSGSVVTVTPVAVGMTTVTVTAQNGGGDADQTFKVTVREPAAPSAVGSLDDLELVVGQPAHPVQVADAFTGDDLTYSAASSTSGVAVVTTSGSVVSVRPLSVGMTTVTVTARNDLGQATQTFDVNVRNPNAPQAVGSLDDITLVLGQPPHDVEVANVFTGEALVFTAVSSNPGRASETVSGSVVTVTPVSAGTTTVTVTATNSAGTATQTFDVTVRNPEAPQAVGSLDDLELEVGQPPHDVEVAGAFSGEYLQFTAVSTNSGVASVTVSGSGSVVSVTPVSAGTTTVMVVATNSAGTVTQEFSVTVRNPGAPQAVGSLADLELEVGQPPHDVEVARAFTGDYLDFTAVSSNPGVASETVSGSVVSVTPVTAGTTTVTVTATNSAGSATQTFDVTVSNPGAPGTRGSLADLELVLGQPPHPVQVARAFTGDYLQFTAVSSTPGIASETVTGSVVSVTPESVGTTTVTVTATNSGGTATQTFDVTVSNPDAPQAVGTLDDLDLVLGEPPHPVQVERAFTGQYLEFTAVSSNPGIASVTVSGSVVAVTPVTLGMTTVTVTATNSAGQATQTFDVTVRNPGAPRPVGSLDDLELVLGQPPHLVRVERAFEGRFLEFTAASSNPGVAPVTVTGSVVTVTPESLGMTTVTVTAQNDGGQATQTFEVTVRNPNAPRAVGTLDDVTLVLGQPPHTVGVASAFEGEFLTHTADSSNPGFATVEIAGTVVTVTPVAVGTTTVTVTASNSVGQATQTFEVTVRNPIAPSAVGSLDDLELILGQPPHTVEIEDAFAGEFLTYAAESSEPGAADVEISGTVVTVTAVAVGTTTVTVTASNRVGQATQTFEVTVRNPIAPRAVGTLDDLELVLGQPPRAVEVEDAFAGELLTYAAESANPGLATVAVSGSVVTVTPVAVGTTTVTVTASNRAGQATQEFEVTVRSLEAPTKVGSLDDLELVLGQPPHNVEVADAFAGELLTYAVESSEPGLAAVAVSGSVVTVTAVAVGTTTVTVTAQNDGGQATQTFAVTVRDDTPIRVGSLDDLELVLGQPPHDVEVADAFAGSDLTYAAESSDPAVTAVAISGSVVTVTPVTVGTATVTVTARNDAGEATQTFEVKVKDAAPAAVGRLDDVTLLVEQPPHDVEVASAFTGTNLMYTAVSSDPSVTVAVTDAVVALTPASVGMATVTVTARNSAGEATQTFGVTVLDVAPSVLRVLDDLTLVVGQPPHEVDLTGAFGGTNLTYAAESSGSAVARAAAGVDVVTVAPVVEGVVTVTVTARNSAGEAAQTFTVTVTTDAAEADLIDDILAAMGRNTLASVRGAITGRFRSAPGRTPGAAARSAAGAALGFSTFRGAGTDAGGLTAGTVFGTGGQAGPASVSRGAPLGAPVAGGAGTSRLDPLLWGNDFVLPLGGGGAAAQADGEAPSPTGAVWGSTDMQWFRGAPQAGRYDGAVKSVYLGVDGRVSDAWTGGVTVALTRASGDYAFASERASGEGSLHTSLNSLYPYVRWTSAAGDEVWGAFGGGVGNARHTRSGAAGSTSASYRLLLGTAGWRRGLVRGDGLRVSAVGDLGIVHLKTQGTAGPLARRRLSVQQVRAGVEAEYAGRQVRPFVQASGRVDGGAGQTGAGIEVAGGVRYGLPSGWAIEALARSMALHSADGYREHGASVTARYAASADGLGLSLALSPRWGAGAQGGGVEALWRDQALQRTLYGMPVQQSALDGTVGYGIAAPRLGGLLTAFGEFDVGAGQSARSGIRLNLAERAIEALDMEVSAARQNFPGFDTDNRIDVLGRLSF